MALIPTAPTLQIGGRIFTDLANLIILHGYIATAAHYGTLRKSNGTAGYQVTGGKTLTIYALVLQNNASASSQQTINIGYGDNDVGTDTATIPTTPIREAGLAAATQVYGQFNGANGTSGVLVHNTDFQIVAAKYMFVQVNASQPTHIMAFGYET